MKFAIALFLALSTPYIYAQNGKVAAKGPEITFPITKHNFGRISEDLVYAKIKFVFTNTGDQDILISNVQTSCGCTTPDWTRDTVKPGGTGFVEAKYETTNRIGTFNKTITVYSNALNNPFVHLDISGEVYKEKTAPGGIPIPDLGSVYMDNPTIDFNPIYDNQIDTMTVRVVNGTPYSMNIENYGNLPAFCKVLNWPKSLEPNEKGKITIALYGALIKNYGYGAFEIPVTTDNPVTPNLGVYVAYTRKQYFPKLDAKALKKAPKISFDKEIQDFGKHQTGDEMDTEFKVTNTGKSELILHEIYPECSCVRVSYPKKKLAAGESMVISVHFDTVNKTGTNNQGIWIVSNDPTRDEMHIYLRAELPAKDFHCPTCH